MFTCLHLGQLKHERPWIEWLPIARQTGWEGVDVALDPAVRADVYRDGLSTFGLKLGGASLPLEFRGEQATFRAGMETLPRYCKLAQEIGLTRFMTWARPAHDTLDYKANFRLHATRLGEAARVLADHGARLGIEFVAPRTARAHRNHGFIHTMHQALELADVIGHGSGIVLDSWHWHASLATAGNIRTLRPEQVVYVHVNDAPRGIPVEQLVDDTRAIAGETGVIDLPTFLGALREIGYDGPVVPEPFAGELARVTPLQAAQRVMDGLMTVWNTPRPQPLPNTMKAIALGNEKAWLVDVATPRPVGNQVIVKMHASPLCGSNLGSFHNTTESVNVGHEGAGEVVAVAQSNLLRVGDRVVVAPASAACGYCPVCMRGDVILCLNQKDRCGQSCQYSRVADVACTRIPDGVSYDHASLLGCAFGPAYDAIQRLGVTPADEVVVSGLGPVGLGAVALASACGAAVVAIDPEPWRREHAVKLGAARSLDPLLPDFTSFCRKHLKGGGVYRGLECSGKESSQRLLLDLGLKRSGIAFIGENYGTIPLCPSKDLIRRAMTLIGSWHMNLDQANALMSFIQRRPDVCELMISHRFGFSQVQEAFDVFAARRSAKVIVHPFG